MFDDPKPDEPDEPDEPVDFQNGNSCTVRQFNAMSEEQRLAFSTCSNKYKFIKNKNEIVQPTWKYSYDGGGFPMVIPEEGPVTADMIGLPAHKAAVAWEYFLKPEDRFEIQEHDTSCKSYRVYCPGGVQITIDYDDVQHDVVDDTVNKMVQILNKEWE